MPRQYLIRPVVLADLDRIEEIERASFGAEAYDRKLFASYLRRCRGLFLAAWYRRRLAGYMLTCLRGGSRGTAAELVSVAVDPSSRQTGAASALLESTVRRLRRRGVARLHLIVRVNNRAAQAFYRKYGFRRLRVVRGYYEDGGDGIAMTRPLS